MGPIPSRGDVNPNPESSPRNCDREPAKRCGRVCWRVRLPEHCSLAASWCLDQLLRPCFSHVLGLTSTNNTQRPHGRASLLGDSLSMRLSSRRQSFDQSAMPQGIAAQKYLDRLQASFTPFSADSSSSIDRSPLVTVRSRPVTPLAVDYCSVADTRRRLYCVFDPTHDRQAMKSSVTSPPKWGWPCLPKCPSKEPPQNVTETCGHCLGCPIG